MTFAQPISPDPSFQRFLEQIAPASQISSAEEGAMVAQVLIEALSLQTTAHTAAECIFEAFSALSPSPALNDVDDCITRLRAFSGTLGIALVQRVKQHAGMPARQEDVTYD